MASLFEAYITNLGKYNEGELVGETLKFPTTTEEVQGLLKRIGVDGVRYEEFFITSFDGDVLGLYDYLGEYENLDELNHLACLLSELDQGELEKFEAVIDSGEHTSSVADLINLAQNLDCYEFYPGVEDDETLGRIYVEDMEAIEVTDEVAEALMASKRAEAAHAERVRYNRAYYSLDCDDGIEYSACVHEPSPQELMDRKELFFRLWNALNSLPEIQGRRVDAHLILGKSYRQIAREEGVDKSAVRCSVKCGIDRMKKYLQENF